MKLQVTCPNCQAVLAADAAYAGRVHACPQCGTAIQIPQGVPLGAARPVPSAAPRVVAPAPAPPQQAPPAPPEFAIDTVGTGGGRAGGRPTKPRDSDAAPSGWLVTALSSVTAFALLVGLHFGHRSWLSGEWSEKACRRYADLGTRQQVEDAVGRHHPACFGNATYLGTFLMLEIEDEKYYSAMDREVRGNWEKNVAATEAPPSPISTPLGMVQRFGRASGPQMRGSWEKTPQGGRAFVLVTVATSGSGADVRVGNWALADSRGRRHPLVAIMTPAGTMTGVDVMGTTAKEEWHFVFETPENEVAFTFVAGNRTLGKLPILR